MSSGTGVLKIQVSWLDAEAKILRADFHEDWTWQDFTTAYDTIIAMTRAAAPQRVDLILYNYTRLFRIPPGNPWPAIRRFAEQIPSNAGIQVQVGGTRASVVFQNIQRYFSPEASARTQFADTLEEALALIAEARTEAETPVSSLPED